MRGSPVWQHGEGDSAGPSAGRVPSPAPYYAQSVPNGKVHRSRAALGAGDRALCGFRPRHGWLDTWDGITWNADRYIPARRVCRRCAERAS